MNKYSADELFKIAYGHLQKKEFEKSNQLFEKLLNDYPDNLSILRNLSHSYSFSGAFKKAEECIKKIIKIKPDEPFAYQFLASVLKSQDKIEEVILATSATVEGQTTAYYIQDSLKNIKTKITKLAQGLPVGGEIESLDDGTLYSAFKFRSDLNPNSD